MTTQAMDGDQHPNPIFNLAQEVTQDDARLVSTSRTWQLLRRFGQNRLAVFGAVCCTLLVLMAIFAPALTPGVTPTTQFDLAPYSLSNLNFPQYGPSLANFPARIMGLTVGGYVYHFESVFVGITYGSRQTLLIAGLSALFSTVIGTVWGAISGYFGGWIDSVLMRLADVVLALPFLPLAIALIIASNLDNLDVTAFVVIFSSLAWANVARVVRATFLTLREQDYAEAARASGVGHWRIIFRHLLPNAVAPIIVATTSNIAAFIVAEATIDYLDLGHSETGGYGSISWGNMISDSQSFLTTGNWWWTFFPGFFILLTVVSVYLVGEGIRDAIDIRGAAHSAKA